MNDENQKKDDEKIDDHECSCGHDCDCGDGHDCGCGDGHDCGDDHDCGGDCHCDDSHCYDDACFCGDAGAEITANQDSYENKYLRALADYQNLLKRTAQEKNEFFQYAIANFLHDILPIYDNLKLSIGSLSETDAKSPWVEGVKHVIKQFKEALESRGITEIKTVGEKFDHNTMEALEGTGELVKKEVKSGYSLNGKVIVPAKVIVE